MRYVAFDVDQAQWRERMEALRFGFAKWDLDVQGAASVPPGALVLSRGEHEALVEASEAMAAITARARRRLAGAPDEAAGLGVHPWVARVAAHDATRPLVTRMDFFLTSEGWRIAEFNDDCPGGYNEAIGLPALLADLVPDGCGLAGDLPDALVRLTSVDKAGIVFATGYAEDLQVARILAGLLATHGIEAVLASPANLEWAAGPVLLGEPVDGLVRFFPTEWMPDLPNLAAWERAAQARMWNPIAAGLTQSKAIHAWLHENEPGALARGLLPATQVLHAGNAEQVTAGQADLVLKPAFGRMGQGVLVGQGCPPQRWRRRIEAVLGHNRTRTFVVQRRFDALPVEVAPGQPRTPCVGVYVVGGSFAGYYSRLSKSPVVAHDAANVLTVVESL